jgi:predicted amidophosphoribosyltransferase
MKTTYIVVKSKFSTCIHRLLCGECFSEIDGKDRFCWGCGAEIDKDTIGAYGVEDLIAQRKKYK